MPWTKSECKPPPELDVLLYFADGTFECGYYAKLLDEEEIWRNSNTLDEFDCEPTHWMHLPPPPEPSA